ncbi:MAG: hypothetical protein QW394_05140 [Thermofilaceae archaeon]
MKVDCEELYRALIRVHNKVEFELSKRNWKTPVPVPWGYVRELIEEGLRLIQEIESRCTDIPYYVVSEKRWLLWRREVVEEELRELEEMRREFRKLFTRRSEPDGDQAP